MRLKQIRRQLEDIATETIRKEAQRYLKQKHSIDNLGDNIKWSNVCVIEIPVREKGEREEYLNK